MRTAMARCCENMRGACDVLTVAIAIGLVLGFILFELTGVIAGGLVSPGYFALYWDRPASIALALGIAVLTLFLLRLAGMVTLLYGRRRFLMALLLGFFLQWSLGGLVMGVGFALGRAEIIGYLVPGIVAHEMDRQGMGATLAALLLLSALTRLVLQLGGMV